MRSTSANLEMEKKIWEDILVEEKEIETTVFKY